MSKAELKVCAVVAEPINHVGETFDNRAQKCAEESGPEQSPGGIIRGSDRGVEFVVSVWSSGVAHGGCWTWNAGLWDARDESPKQERMNTGIHRFFSTRGFWTG